MGAASAAYSIVDTHTVRCAVSKRKPICRPPILIELSQGFKIILINPGFVRFEIDFLAQGKTKTKSVQREIAPRSPAESPCARKSMRVCWGVSTHPPPPRHCDPTPRPALVCLEATPVKSIHPTAAVDPDSAAPQSQQDQKAS